MTDKVKVPPEAFKRPVQTVPSSLSDRQQRRAFKKSGLVYMLERCYPQISSQHN